MCYSVNYSFHVARTMSSSTDKISLQENRIGDSSTVEATDTIGEVADISDAVFPESGNITSKASSADSASSPADVFDPMVVITAEQTSAPTSAGEGEDKVDSSKFVPSIF